MTIQISNSFLIKAKQLTHAGVFSLIVPDLVVGNSTLLLSSKELLTNKCAWHQWWWHHGHGRVGVQAGVVVVRVGHGNGNQHHHGTEELQHDWEYVWQNKVKIELWLRRKFLCSDFYTLSTITFLHSTPYTTAVIIGSTTVKLIEENGVQSRLSHTSVFRLNISHWCSHCQIDCSGGSYK